MVTVRPQLTSIRQPLTSFKLASGHSQSRSRNFKSWRAIASDVPVATDAPMQISPVSAVRKYLLSVGWELAWIDGVTTEITKRTLKTSVEQCEAVIRYLTGLGLPTHVIENMVSISKPILGRSVDQLEAVVSWVKRQGLGDAAALELLRAHPMLLTYDPAPDSSYLQKGQARAALNFGKRNGLKVVGVVQWREGAAFKGPPVTPTPPASL